MTDRELTFADMIVATDTSPKRVQLGDGHVFVRYGSLAEKAALEDGAIVDGALSRAKLRAGLLHKAIVKGDGSQLLTEEEAKKLVETPGIAGKVEPLVDEAMKRFGFTKDDAGALEKN